VLVKTLGADNVVKVAPIMGSEDLVICSKPANSGHDVLAGCGRSGEGKTKQRNRHAFALAALALFAPLPEPTLRTGVKAMTSAVLELMKKP